MIHFALLSVEGNSLLALLSAWSSSDPGPVVVVGTFVVFKLVLPTLVTDVIVPLVAVLGTGQRGANARALKGVVAHDATDRRRNPKKSGRK